MGKEHKIKGEDRAVISAVFIVAISVVMIVLICSFYGNMKKVREAKTIEMCIKSGYEQVIVKVKSYNPYKVWRKAGTQPPLYEKESK